MRRGLGAVAIVALAGCGLYRVHPGNDIAPAGAQFTVVDIEPWRGRFQDQVHIHLQRAAAIGQAPYVELTAVWCGPCHVIEKSLRDTAVMRAFRGTYIMRVDVDHWVAVTGKPVTNGIPAFIALDSTGRWLPRRMVGSPEKPKEIAEAFDAFFHPGE